MDLSIANFALFLVATFAAALVTGVAGFAFGLIAAAIWLHILTPLQTASLIIGFGLVVQGVSVWKLRHALKWTRLWPFLIGAGFGVPLGVAILDWANADHVRIAIGAILVLYSIYAPPAVTLIAGRASGRRRRLPQRRARRSHRLCRHSGHHLV